MSQCMSASELAKHDGSTDSHQLLIALSCSRTPTKATILDVTSGANHYGQGCAYHMFAGRDCSRAFSLGSLDTEHLHGDMSNATSAEWQLLDQWHEKLTEKYPAVGYTAVEPTAESPLPRELTQTVQLMASRGGLDAEQIASMLKLEVDKVQATLEASARRMLDRRPWQRGASSATTTASAGILREVGAFVSSPKQVEDPLLVDDKDEWRVVGVDSPELE